MQDNNQEQSVVQKQNIVEKFLACVKLFFVWLKNFFVWSGVVWLIKTFISPSGIWSLTLLILFLYYFPFQDLENKKSADWFFNTISKLIGKSSIPSDMQIHGDVDATVSMPFKNPIQACGYYHTNYKNSHSYTVLWDKSKLVNVKPKIEVRIRVIADPAYWQAEKCTEEKGEVKLIGIEYTKHSIQAQFKEGKDFIHIATADAYYRSALSFDKNGRITERKVLGSNFEYEPSPHLCNPIKEAATSGKVECPDLKGKKEYTFAKLTKRPDNFNILKISSDFDLAKNSVEENIYQHAIILYINEREKLHKELIEKGCGAISIEPELTEGSDNPIQTSIAFLCLKKSGPSHVRLMHRISEQIF